MITIDFAKYPYNIVVLNNSEKTMDLNKTDYNQVKTTFRMAKLTSDTHLKEISLEAIRKIINYYPELGI